MRDESTNHGTEPARPAAQTTDESVRSPLRTELGLTNIGASALAAASAAVAASYLGLAGTIAGAAIASVVATAGTAIYRHYLDRTRVRFRDVPQRVKRATAGRVKPEPVAVGQQGAEPTGSAAPSWVQQTRAALRGVSWGPVAGASALVFAGVFGAITVFEYASGRSIANWLGVDPRPGTSVGIVLDARKPRPSTTPQPIRSRVSPSPNPSLSPTASVAPSGSSSPSPSPSRASGSPTPSPRQPTEDPQTPGPPN